jgi:hypothetical protein
MGKRGPVYLPKVVQAPVGPVLSPHPPILHVFIKFRNSAQYVEGMCAADARQPNTWVVLLLHADPMPILSLTIATTMPLSRLGRCVFKAVIWRVELIFDCFAPPVA